MTIEELITKWRHVYPPYESSVKRIEYTSDVRKATGCGLNDVNEAIRIEDWDIKLVVERLNGKRPPEWKLKFDALEERIKRIEDQLQHPF